MPTPPRGPSLHLDLDRTGATTVARLVGCGRITEDEIAAVRELFARLAEGAARDVRLDLAGVEFISSIGLVELLVLQRRLRQRGFRLEVVNLRPEARDVLVATNLSSILGLTPPGRSGPGSG